jgi:peptide/nickel transport system permease protein
MMDMIKNKTFLMISVLLLAAAMTIATSPVKMVVLWTDALVFILVAMITGVVLLVRSKPYLIAPWHQVLKGRMAAAALVVLLSYVAIGLLDSVHFREPLPPQEGSSEIHFSPQALSLLDHLLGPIRTQVEKSYSAPFATHLYARESIEQPDGGAVRDYPRLAYGGAHLTSLEEKGRDISITIAMAVSYALVLWLAIAALIIWNIGRHHGLIYQQQFEKVVSGECELPWRTVLLTLLVILLLACIAMMLGGKYHIFGTDKVGQDVFYQTIKSIRTGLIIGTLTTLVMLPFAVALGVAAGYFRGWVDDLIQYVYTTLNSIPGVLLIAAAVLIMQAYIAGNPDMFETMEERADARLLFLCLILGITSWTGLCRLLRGEALKLRELDYVQAAHAFGVRQTQILSRHIFPNVMHIVLIAIVLDFSGLVLAEAVLSYVGIGVDPTMNSWGNMINGARLEMAREPMVWWSLMAAFVFMFVLVLAANLFADAVRDAFDPRAQR